MLNICIRPYEWILENINIIILIMNVQKKRKSFTERSEWTPSSCHVLPIQTDCLLAYMYVRSLILSTVAFIPFQFNYQSADTRQQIPEAIIIKFNNKYLHSFHISILMGLLANTLSSELKCMCSKVNWGRMLWRTKLTDYFIFHLIHIFFN